MSEENILVPKSRYDKLVADSFRESEKRENEREFDNELQSVDDDEKINLGKEGANDQKTELDSQDSLEKNKGENNNSPNQSPGRTVEDISQSSVPHITIRPPGTKSLSKIKTQSKNRTKKTNLKKGGKKSVTEQTWIKW